ncbi:hypothetical protein [Alteribacillus sp. HJP-4]|uniref:hypothetical protein n=1 Tax=Alteribacillus sp. HJP-4 TaxID=2775394 RepID=UPI0035CCC8E7
MTKRMIQKKHKDANITQWRSGYYLLSDTPAVANVIKANDFFGMQVYKADRKRKNPRRALSAASRKYPYCHLFEIMTAETREGKYHYAVLEKTMKSPDK